MTMVDESVFTLNDPKVKTIYLAGGMSGYENFNYDCFIDVATIIRAAGYVCLNPAEFQGGDQEMSWHDYMRYDLRLIIDRADAIITLPGWEDSKGACNEVTVARAIGIPVWGTTELGIPVTMNAREARWAIDHPDADTASTPVVLSGTTVPTTVYIGDTHHYEAATNSWVPNVSEPEFVLHETILEEATRLVHGARGEDYGHPLDDFTKTGLIWTAVLTEKLKPEVQVEAEDVALCMVGVKISREVNRPKRDNRVDGCGYFETLDMVVAERERRNKELTPYDVGF